MKKEAINHGVLDDLANRNENWKKLDDVIDQVVELDESRPILKNEIVNGDFSNGTTGWGTTNVTIDALNNELKLTITALNPNSRIFQNINTIVGNKYYLYYQINAPKERTAGFNFSVIESNILTIPNEWTTISAVRTPLASPTPLWCIYNTSVGYEIGDTYMMRNVICIDVTTVFGAGNEPTKEEMDLLISQIGYIDGEITLTQTQLLNWNLELNRFKANKQQEAWITPTLLNGWENTAASTPISYYKDTLGVVHFRGSLKSGVNGTDAFILPVGYRPSSTIRSVGMTSDNTVGRYDINVLGGVRPHKGSGAYIYAVNVSFRAEG